MALFWGDELYEVFSDLSFFFIRLGFRNKDAKFGQKEGATKTGVCGSFLKFNPGVLGRIAERIKVAAPADKEGSLTTKNFVFRTEEKPVLLTFIRLTDSEEL